MRLFHVTAIPLAAFLLVGCETGQAGAGDCCSTTPKTNSRPAVDATARVSAKAAFTDVQGKVRHPLDVGDNKCNVLIFITTDCPIANQYSPQIRELCTKMSDKPVQFFLVHVDPDVTDATARKHAEDYGHVCPVIRDAMHQLVKHTGIDKTPEAVVLDRKGEIVYRGRINNWYGDLGRKRVAPSKHELRDAIQAVLAGREVKVKRTEAVGCFVPPVN